MFGNQFNLTNKFQNKFVNNQQKLGMSGTISQSITITPVTTTVVPTRTPPQTSVSIIPVATVMTPTTLNTPKSTMDKKTPINRMPQTKLETSESLSKERTISLGKSSPRTPVVTNFEGRRRSSRSIKRKRFDDEIVEYSVNSTTIRDQHRGGARPRSVSKSFASTTTAPLHSPGAVALGRPNIVAKQNVGMRIMPKMTMSAERIRRNPRTGRKRKVGTGRPSNQVAVRDLGRWKPIDDLILITGIQQTLDLRVIHRACKFSCRFTLPEIQARWYSLLYEPAISRTSAAAIRNLHPQTLEAVQRRVMFTNREEEVLSYIKSTKHPELEVFEELLRKHGGDFHSQRTAKCLLSHWNLMRQYQLLCDQMPKPLSKNNQPISFSDAEDQMMDTELNDQRDETLEIELALANRSQKRHIRIIETKLSRWNVLIDSMTGTNSVPEFDSQTLAILRGRFVRYLMRSKEITFGRDARDQNIDVDLSLDGPSSKISRKQGTIKLRSSGDFFIANEGKRAIYINGLPLSTGNKTRLANNFVVEVCGLRLVFLTNYELINAIRHESAKTTSPLN